jgi:hypothetical protein
VLDAENRDDRLYCACGAEEVAEGSLRGGDRDAVAEYLADGPRLGDVSDRGAGR